MKTILFCNTKEPNCGVYQYGVNLCNALMLTRQFHVLRVEPSDEGEMCSMIDVMAKQTQVAAVIYNWHPGQGGWMAGAPFNLGRPVKQLLVFHEAGADTSRFDAVLFSDPTMVGKVGWHDIPRPLPHWMPTAPRPQVHAPMIGVHGFGGATADKVLERVQAEFDQAVVRAHLPFARYGDANGAAALNMARHLLLVAQRKPSVVVEISHHWMAQNELLGWLSENDLNCYIRDTSVNWPGVSSALDAALAVHRPLAVNACQGFRHVFGCQPSILLEHRSLKEILATGVEPLKPLYESNSREKLVARVEQVLEQIGL